MFACKKEQPESVQPEIAEVYVDTTPFIDSLIIDPVDTTTNPVDTTSTDPIEESEESNVPTAYTIASNILLDREGENITIYMPPIIYNTDIGNGLYDLAFTNGLGPGFVTTPTIPADGNYCRLRYGTNGVPYDVENPVLTLAYQGGAIWHGPPIAQRDTVFVDYYQADTLSARSIYFFNQWNNQPTSWTGKILSFTDSNNSFGDFTPPTEQDPGSFFSYTQTANEIANILSNATLQDKIFVPAPQ